MDIDTEIALRKDPDCTVRRELAGRANLRIDTEIALRADIDTHVRIALARNPSKLQLDTEVALRNDKYEIVRAALAERSDLTLDSIVALASVIA